MNFIEYIHKYIISQQQVQIKQPIKMSIQKQVRNNRIFGICLLLCETVLIFMFGFFITYSPTPGISDDHFIIATLIFLALAGFGLITTYIKPVSIATITHIIIILGFSIQLYFPLRGFWQIIGLSGSKFQQTPSSNILPISITNSLNDRQISQTLSQSPITDYIACFISLIIGYSGFIGRVGNLQVLFYTIIGTFIYQFNSMIFWRLWITDCGYGMRIFLFAGSMGLLASLILGKKQTTINHIRFISDYYYQAINLIGAIIIWCLFPVLNWSDLWHSSILINTSNSRDTYILHVVSLNMWFALCGSVIGSVCICILLYRKLSIHTLIFSIFTGGIAYSSISDIYLNPGLAMGIGTITSFISSLLVSKLKLKMNKNGIRDSNGIFASYLIPGLIAGILSAIFHANGAQNYSTYYTANTNPYKTTHQQGGIQLAGFGIAIGLGLFAGLVSGLLMKMFNQRDQKQQINPNMIVNQIPLAKIEDQQHLVTIVYMHPELP